MLVFGFIRFEFILIIICFRNSQSFRFGPEIAFMANSCLKNFKNLQNRSLVGAKIHDSINSSSPLRFGGDAGQVCILSRTNLSLFQKVVEIIGCHKTEIPTNPLKIFIVGVCCCLLFFI